MSSFFRLLTASLIKPSLLINSVYIRSAPLSLHTARNGGSLTSSMGARSNGNSGRIMLSIFIIRFSSQVLFLVLYLSGKPANLHTYHRNLCTTVIRKVFHTQQVFLY